MLREIPGYSIKVPAKSEKSEGAGLNPAPLPSRLSFPNEEPRQSLTVGQQVDNPGESQPCGRRCRPNWKHPL